MTKKNIIFTVLLIAIAVSWRIINHEFMIAPNLELVTTASVIAAITMGLGAAVIVPISSMILSDMIIGNSSIFMFTWASFLIIGIAAIILKKYNDAPKKQIMYSAGFAVISSCLFFVVTNFGVWLEGWYPMTMAGLTADFVSAIPFYRTMLIGNIILVPSAVSIYQFAKARATSKELVVNSHIGN